jgi:hypothetical protein
LLLQANEYEKGVYELLRHMFVHNDLPFEYLRRMENKRVFAFPNSWLSPSKARDVIFGLCILVEKKLSRMLPDKFALYFDGWSHNRLHYLGLVASFIADNKLQARLLSLSPLQIDLDDADGDDIEDEGDDIRPLFSTISGDGNPKLSPGFSAPVIADNALRVLTDCYRKNWSNVTNLGGDNCSTSHAVCAAVNKPFDPCCSHLHSLEMNRLVKTQDPLASVLEKVLDVMKEGAKPKVAAEISHHTELKTTLPGQTRWSSAVLMLNRYFRWLKEGVIESVPSLRDVAPERGLRAQAALARDIFELQDMWCKDLQKGGPDPREVNLSNSWHVLEAAAHALEDECNSNPLLDPYAVQYISRSSAICDKPSGNKHFLEGIIKIQRGHEMRLTTREKTAVAAFKKPTPIAAASREDEPPMSPSAKRRKMLLEKKEVHERDVAGSTAEASDFVSAYIDTRFVVGTNNVCERVFSRARRVGTEFRKSMDPLTFEAIIFLKLNEDLWSSFEVVQALKMDPSRDFNVPFPGSGFLYKNDN